MTAWKQLTATRGDDSVDDVDSPARAASGIVTAARVGMALSIDRNLAHTDIAAAPWLAAPQPVPDRRAEFAAQFIPAGARVLELHCGPMALRRYLPHGCRYQGCDLIARAPDTVVCDLNAGEFPTQAAAAADVIVMLGVLETIVDVESLFTHLRFCKRDVVLSYCATNLTGKCDRAALGWINHFGFFELARLFDRYGFRIECTAPVDGVQALMRLTPTERMMPLTPCRVAVVSEHDAGSFGGRLARHMINALLPGEAEVDHLTFATLGEARSAYDLVVLGTGASLFQPLIGEEVLDLVARAKASIGIFGTQYRELIPRAGLDRLIDRLDCWFARYQDDVLIYGRGRNNVVHLGDWLIDLFPLATPTDDEPLRIGADADLPPARAVETIQRHKQVFSAAPYPFLCALTAAELAAYEEKPAATLAGAVSGNFRSMLLDIFGRSYAQKEFFLVERDAVARYKARVHRNVAAMRERIDSLLRNVAAAI
jgi:Methyltransferase domain